MGAIDDLVSLVPPPAAPVDGDGDWRAVEETLRLRLPADYKVLIRRYGLGQFDDITPLTPFDTHTDGVLDLVKHARDLLGGFAQHRDEWPEDFPYPLYPETNGLLEWATTGDGDSLCWLTAGEPDSWPVVVWNIREGAHCYDLGAVELLHGYLSGRQEVALLRPPLAVPWFDPYRERSEVYVALSDGDLPYPERLRILREALAPTADRGGWDGGNGQRQDHFKAVERDCLLTYESLRAPDPCGVPARRRPGRPRRHPRSRTGDGLPGTRCEDQRAADVARGWHPGLRPGGQQEHTHMTLIGASPTSSSSR